MAGRVRSARAGRRRRAPAAQRGLFIIDPEGVLRYAVVTADNVGRSVEETLRVLQALQTGGLCPAEWTPGKELLTVGA